nr:hypothetical protein CFP56_62123 [Quercus suber]
MLSRLSEGFFPFSFSVFFSQIQQHLVFSYLSQGTESVKKGEKRREYRQTSTQQEVGAKRKEDKFRAGELDVKRVSRDAARGEKGFALRYARYSCRLLFSVGETMEIMETSKA